MSGHGFYLWMSYGATALAIAVELAVLAARRVKARRMVEEERELEAQD
ncbi:MAG TPA: heme exporter protein CcmD [Usitatibacter sp.]|nr:heme exporter protein CcmD [Usitatibacter sp.]